MLSSQLDLRQAARLVGVGESTLSRWCDSGAIAMTKTIGGHCRIERHVLLQFARAQGLPIIGSEPLATARRGASLPDSAKIISRLFEQLVSGEEHDIQKLTQALLIRTGDSATVYDAVLAPAMHRVGTSWEQAGLQSFRDDAAPAPSLSGIGMAGDRMPIPANAPTAVCAALPGDPYSLAPSMCSMVMRAAGFQTTLLGPGMPTEEILKVASDISASVVAVSIDTNPDSPHQIIELCDEMDARDIRIVLGGRGLSNELCRSLRRDSFGVSMRELVEYSELLLRRLTGSTEKRVSWAP